MSETEQFKVEHRGFIATAFYDDDPKVQDANIVVTREGVPYHEFKYPAYRIWNIAAHWPDMVEGTLADEAKQAVPRKAVRGSQKGKPGGAVSGDCAAPLTEHDEAMLHCRELDLDHGR